MHHPRQLDCPTTTRADQTRCLLLDLPTYRHCQVRFSGFITIGPKAGSLDLIHRLENRSLSMPRPPMMVRVHLSRPIRISIWPLEGRCATGVLPGWVAPSRQPDLRAGLTPAGDSRRPSGSHTWLETRFPARCRRSGSDLTGPICLGSPSLLPAAVWGRDPSNRGVSNEMFLKSARPGSWP